ncbi:MULTISPECIES: hypothetical protein [unclassified Streptomyces]|uniref:hypothetical protein n=1 Tax=unclassified Streptomyces TaxID=2593676 RepID=UPI002E804841|nr:hypothetical protein [Streptomyces sp. NBC_00589]WTI33883.1 hypothetical protein OIC96_02225 [Streptomyces sp. NBC_00775]WUB32444.1 hypothetical protein OHA51_47505 [Streptomyces sp. NBC_00589]
MRAPHAGLAACAAVLLLSLTACGGHAENRHSPASSSSPSSSSSTDLAQLRKLVNDAESAASSAESEMARE